MWIIYISALICKPTAIKGSDCSFNRGVLITAFEYSVHNLPRLMETGIELIECNIYACR